MRNSVSSLIGCAVLLALIASQAEIEAESVIGIWLFDSNDGNVAIDSSDNGNDGEIKGAVNLRRGGYSRRLDTYRRIG